MGVCHCNQNITQITVKKEMPLNSPPEILNDLPEISNPTPTVPSSPIKLQLHSSDSTISQANLPSHTNPPPKKQFKKNVIKITHLNNQITLTSAIKEINDLNNPHLAILKQFYYNIPDIQRSESNSKTNTLSSMSNSINPYLNNSSKVTDTCSMGKGSILHTVSKTPEIINRSVTNNIVKYKSPTHYARHFLEKANGPNNLQNKNYKFSNTALEITEEEEQLLKQCIMQHELFCDFSENAISQVLDRMNVYQLEADRYVFKEGEFGKEFYLIRSGEMELKTKVTNIVLTSGKTFGELALLRRKCVRTYSALSRTAVDLLILTYENYYEIMKIEGMLDKLKQHRSEKEDFMCEITNYYLLKYLSISIKGNLALFARFLTLTEHNILISSPPKQNIVQNDKNKSKTYIQEAYLTHPECLVFPLDGNMIETFGSDNTRIAKYISKGEAAGFIYTIFKLFRNKDYSIVFDNPSNKIKTCIVLSETALIESLGANYANEILFSYFNAKIAESDIIMQLLPHKSKNKCNTMYYYNSLFQGFTLKHYHKGEVVFSRNNFDFKKHVLLLHGGLIPRSHNHHVLFGDKYINCQDESQITSLISENELTIALESTWKNTKEILRSIPENSALFTTYDNLSKIILLHCLKEQDLFSISAKVKKLKFAEKQTIIEQGKINTHFYFITKGSVKMHDNTPEKGNNKTIRVFDAGNCFGELSLLYEEPSPYSYTAKDKSVCYSLKKGDFITMLSDKKVNDYIKKKILLQDNNISLSNLYFLCYLGKGGFGNVCLVHNKIAFYAAKAINKIAAEKQNSCIKNLINEKKSMLAVDHPFIVKMVRTLKKDNWCFFLEEYIRGINFDEYMTRRQTVRNVYETKFYGACLFAMLAYLNKKHVIHRDIKPSNLMIDQRGYLKLIDFGTAKVVKGITSSIIGTPNFIAPELLQRVVSYSSSCDYWSIGVCLYYIYYGRLPFGGDALEIVDIFRDILYRDPEYPEDTNPEVKKLISDLLIKQPLHRIKTFSAIQKELLFKDFPWDELIKYNIKPFYVPPLEVRDNPKFLNDLGNPFEEFIESEQFETIQMRTLGINNTKENRESAINSQWFEDF